jgi:DNA-binding NarL/FixJ family response regulator
MRRVVVVECPGLFAKGLFTALAANLPDYEIVFAADLISACRDCAAIGVPELMLVDMNAPAVTWASLRALRQKYPRMRLVAMCQNITRADAILSFENGLAGCVSKTQSAEEILGAISDVISGRTYIHPTVKVLDDRRAPSPIWDCEQPALPNAGQDRKLTRRQLDLLPLLAAGKSNKEIARALKIAEGTVKIHASSLLRVLGARNRTEVAVIAVRSSFSRQAAHGVAEPEPPSPGFGSPAP